MQRRRYCKRPASAMSTDEAALHRHLVQCGTKTGLVSVLTALMDAGWMKADVISQKTHAIKGRLTKAQRAHADKITPYGPVCQVMDLGIPELNSWRYCHPLALLWYLSTISASFADVMFKSNVDGMPFHVILYIDEICPGNPLRPEKSRTLQAIYWAFSEWPQHVLQRTAAWPVFGTLRSTLADKVPGGVSGLIKQVLLTFFNPGGASLSNGVVIAHSGGSLLVTAELGGFLMDEKAHNQVLGSKGASGTKPCLTCKNCYNRVSKHAIDATEGAIGISCHDPDLFDKHTDESLYEMYDHLAAMPANDPEYQRLSQLFGMHVLPHGIMSCSALRSVIRPVNHHLRDWMHIIVGNGVANCECALIVGALERVGISVETVSAYIQTFVLPKKHGRCGRQREVF